MLSFSLCHVYKHNCVLTFADHTLPEEVAVRENVDAEEPSDDYPEPPSTFHIPSPTAPEAPAESPEKVNPGEEDEEVDEVEFRPHFSAPEGIPERARR